MKKAYARPSLLEYGAVGSLTLGQGGALPDYDSVSGQQVNNTCDPDFNPLRIGCLEAPGGTT